MHALGLEFGSAAQLSKKPGSVWNCLWGNALKRSPGIIRKRRVSYPGPGFLSSATWPMLPKKHYNGLNQIYTIWSKTVTTIKVSQSVCCNLPAEGDSFDICTLSPASSRPSSRVSMFTLQYCDAPRPTACSQVAGCCMI